MLLRLRNLIKITTTSRSICQSSVRCNDETPPKEISGSVATKFQVFRDQTGIIFDIEEERRRRDENELDVTYQNFPSPYEGINIERGVSGVFDIGDLVDVLKKENARNLCVIKIPKEIKYVDYFCLVDGISYRHMIGMAEFVRQCFKKKRNRGDLLPKIEGEKSKDWIAMDLGNIALHIFTKQSRSFYDLESLWCLGEEYEKQIRNSNRQHDIYQMYLDEAAKGPHERNVPQNEIIEPIDYKLEQL